MSPLRTPANVVSFALKMRSERDGNQSEWESTRKISHKHQEIREELGAIVDGEGNPIQTDEMERPITYLLRSHLEDCQFRYEIQEWLDDRRFSL